MQLLCCAALALSIAAMGLVMGSKPNDQERAFKEPTDKIKPLHQPKRKPGPRDWLASHDEPGQTFEQYVDSKPNRPNGIRTTIYLQPIGEFDDAHDELIAETADLLARFYKLPTKVLIPLGLEVIPENARRVHPSWGDRQILTTYVLDKLLKPRCPADAVALLALTTSDLWPGKGWNFVFGQASLRERVGLWSLYRYGNPQGSAEERQQFRRRVFKVAIHETGHMLGIKHCIAYECLMNGSNHLAEMDARPMWFCPKDARKVWWACKADPLKRYRSLAEFAEKHSLNDEAKFWRESLDQLTGKQSEQE